MRIDWHRIVTPSSWVQLGKVNWKYDEFINHNLDKHGIVIVDEFEVKIGKQRIWVRNYPYSFGHPYGENGESYTLPSVKTRKRIKKMLYEKDWSCD